MARQPQAGLPHERPARRLVDDGIRGLTSNPTILQKAISGSADYDEQFKELAVDDHPVLDDYWALVIQDINGALDVFAPLYEASDGGDGFASVEVAPDLARDTQGTIESARVPARADQPAEPAREDPRHRRGRPGDRADDQRGPQHQRDVDLQPRSLRRRHRGLPLRARGVRGRPLAVSRAWRRSSSAGSTPRSTAGSTRSARPTRSPSAARLRSPRESSRTSCSARSSTVRDGTRSWPAAPRCNGRCGRRRPRRTRPIPTRCTSIS